jgi:hypothetical protein
LLSEFKQRWLALRAGNAAKAIENQLGGSFTSKLLPPPTTNATQLQEIQEPVSVAFVLANDGSYSPNDSIR